MMKLELRNIEKSFGEKNVLTGVSFQAESGKAFGLLGRNGAGKTTSIRILMKVFPADKGEIIVNGTPIDYKKIRIGYLPEERGLYPKKGILEQLVYLGELKGMGHKDAVKSVNYWLKRLEMTEYRNKKLDTLSKGNQQKIQLIAALAHNPDIVILDEPFSGLDPVNAMLLKEVVKEEIGKGKIVLFSSHQMNYIEEFCDRIAILHQGRVALQGDIFDIKREYPRDSLVVRSQQAKRIMADLASVCKKAEEGCLLIKLSDSEEKKKIMTYLIDNYDIDEVKVFEPSLNDIFVEYTKDGMREEE